MCPRCGPALWCSMTHDVVPWCAPDVARPSGASPGLALCRHSMPHTTHAACLSPLTHHASPLSHIMPHTTHTSRHTCFPPNISLSSHIACLAPHMSLSCHTTCVCGASVPRCPRNAQHPQHRLAEWGGAGVLTNLAWHVLCGTARAV